MRKIIIVILLIIVSITSFLIGVNVSKEGVAISFDRTQAKLSFHHLNAYNDLQSDFLSGCRSRVKSSLEKKIDEQKMLIAEYVQRISDEKFEDYVTFRDSDLIEELRSYKVDWKKTWTLPACKK